MNAGESLTVTNEAVACGTTAATSDEIQIEGFVSGAIHIVSGAITTLTWHAAVKSSKSPVKSLAGADVAPTFYAAQDASGSPVTQTVAASKIYPIPAILFGAAALKCAVNTAGVMAICLKTN